VTDLLVGVAIIGLLSALLFVAARRIAPALPVRLTNLLAIFFIALMIAFVLLVQGRPFLARVLPFSNLIVVGNCQPLIVSIFAGIVWCRLPAALWRRALVIFGLTVACLYGMYEPVLGQTPKLDERWQDGVCLQTSQASCSPAAAATLLRLHNIRATEQEMAMLCLSTTEGTSAHGLYRGLKLKTEGSGWDVYMFDGATIDDLKRAGGPVLISVELRPADRIDPRYIHTFGWMPGVAHTVVLLEFVKTPGNPELVRIADPSIGHETWPIDDLRLLWHGEGALLVRAKP